MKPTLTPKSLTLNRSPDSTPARRPLAGDEAAQTRVLCLHGTKIDVLLRGVQADFARLLSSLPADIKAADNIHSLANPTKPPIEVELRELKIAGATTIGDVARFAVDADLGSPLAVYSCAYLTMHGEGQHR